MQIKPLISIRAVLAISGAMSVALGVSTAAAGIPVCDQLRKCAAELAVEMDRSPGWRPETIAQYRRLSVAALEEAPNAVAMCRSNLAVIGKNAKEFHARGRLKRLPDACQ